MPSVTQLWDDIRVAGKMIMMDPAERRAFEALELRIRAILPEEYRDRYEDVEPVSMGTAALKYGRDGKVAWHDTWGSFCDLAMAGGPPHKGKLLLPASQAEVEAEPERYQQVVDEICRGVEMVAFLPAERSPVAGWVRVECETAVAAGWLARAIVMENVSAACEGSALELPAGPAYRIEKEIKNVITAIAKTGHYWLDHTGPSQQRVIADLFSEIAAESPLIQPARSGYGFSDQAGQQLRCSLANRIREATGLEPSPSPCDGWLGVVCPSVKAAIWMMRGMVVSNVFARREDTVLFLPVNPHTDPQGDAVLSAFCRVHRFARVRSVL
jgi:sirohydrochlorin cobaltochelatase